MRLFMHLELDSGDQTGCKNIKIDLDKFDQDLMSRCHWNCGEDYEDRQAFLVGEASELIQIHQFLTMIHHQFVRRKNSPKDRNNHGNDHFLWKACG